MGQKSSARKLTCKSCGAIVHKTCLQYPYKKDPGKNWKCALCAPQNSKISKKRCEMCWQTGGIMVLAKNRNKKVFAHIVCATMSPHTVFEFNDEGMQLANIDKIRRTKKKC